MMQVAERRGASTSPHAVGDGRVTEVEATSARGKDEHQRSRQFVVGVEVVVLHAVEEHAHALFLLHEELEQVKSSAALLCTL